MLTSVLVAGAQQSAASPAAASPPLTQAAADASPTVADTPSVADAGTASAVAKRYDHPVLIDSDTTAVAETSALPNGSLQSTISAVPARVRQGATWTPIDQTLTQSSDGMWAPKAATLPVEFSAGGTGALARAETSSGKWVSVNWSAGPLPTPTVDDDTATYSEVFPGVDLQLTATQAGMSEVLVVKDAAAAADPGLSSVSFQVTGGSTTQTTGDVVTASASDGSSVVSAAPTWWDSSGTGNADGPDGASVPVPAQSSTTSNGETINVSATTAAAVAPTYPVYVDPDWTGGFAGRTFVDNAYPNQSYWNGGGASDSYQHVGYVSAASSDDGRSHVTRAFWRMNLAGLPANAYVSNATFNTIDMYSYSCSARAVTLALANDVNSSTTWNNQPSYTMLLDNQSFAYGYNSSCPSHSVGFNATVGIRQVLSQGGTIAPLELLGPETDQFGWKKFDATTSTSLTVTYTLPPSATTIWNASCNRAPGMVRGDVLNINDARWSANGMFELLMQVDGNLVIYHAQTAFSPVNATAIWQTATGLASWAAAAGTYVVFQNDGNIVMYRPGVTGALWYTGGSANYFFMQDDGNLVAYNTVGTPVWNKGSYSSASPTFTCFDNHATTQSIVATATQPNNANIYYQFNETGAATNSPTSLPVAGGIPFTWNAPSSAQGDYQFQVRACLAAPDGTPVCGGWSTLIGTTVDTTPPAAPTLNYSTSTATAVGTVGVTSLNVAVSAPATADHVYGYQYQVLPYSAAASSVPFTANPACGNAAFGAGITTACSSAISGGVSVTVTPPEQTSEFAVEAFDMAGNTSAPVAAQFTATPDYADAKNAHAWETDLGPGSGSTCTTAVPDVASATNPQNLSVVGSACWRNDSAQQLPWGLTGSLQFTGSSTVATTSGVVNTAASFSVGAWLLTTSHTSVETAISQRATNTSAFTLQNNGGHWAFCAPRSDSSSAIADCAQVATSVSDNQWVYVVGVYDAVNHQLRIYSNSSGTGGAPAAVVTHPTNAGSTGPLVVGAGGVPAGSATWSGQIADPLVFQGVASANLISAFGSQLCRPIQLDTTQPCT